VSRLIHSIHLWPPDFCSLTKPGKVIELNRQHMLDLVQNDTELSEILMRAFILSRMELAAAGVGDGNM
jgi:hypothetical protein